MILTKSSGIKKIPNLEKFFSEPIKFIHWYNWFSPNSEMKIIGWGRRPSFYKAQKYALKHNIPLLTLEDGFIRSIGLGVQGYQPLSLIVDELGVYFDAYKTSTLEQLINVSKDRPERALEAMASIRKNQLSKYNHAPTIRLEIDTNKKQILVVDQTFGDQSIKFAGANSQTFEKMLQQAKSDYPDVIIWLKVHPDVISGKKKGHFDALKLAEDAHIKVLAQNCNPIALLEQMDEVYVVSSHMGFEALMLGKKVHCFGVPWYAGWGLTNDGFAPVEILQGRRQIKRSLTQLFSAAYFDYARYENPNTGQRCELEDIIELLAHQKCWMNRIDGEIHAWGFSLWKQSFIKQYLYQPNSQIKFKPVKGLIARIFYKKTTSDHLIVWGYKEPNNLKNLLNGRAKIWRMEDGFIRSIGLGANLIRPLSLVLDDQGIYYDPTQPSRLETILNHIELNAEQKLRATNLQQLLVDQQLSKYNVGEAEDWPQIPSGRTVILVPGQVEDDASVRLGGCGIYTNLALLQMVRKNHPQAWIVYKPHPDVVAGLRPGKIDSDTLNKYTDSTVYKLDMPSCLEKVDEIHTISSLTGFEALIRHKKVYCYGLPFYAGWGLTHDRIECVRRRKRLSLDELVYGTLVDYPLYKLPLPHSDYLATPEQAIDYLINQRRAMQEIGQSIHRSWLARLRAFFIYKR